MTRSRLWLALAAAGLGTFIGLVAEAEEGDVPPWDERAIRLHVDFGAIAGDVSATAAAELTAVGEQLFTARFTTLDGAGRPLSTQAIIPTLRLAPVADMFMRTGGLDANSCASCHRDPAPGGAGDFTVNVFVSEGFTAPDFDTIDPSFSSERGTNHLFGAGLIELLGREMSADLIAQREAALAEARATGEPVTAALTTKGVSFGSLVVHPDGIVDFTGIEGIDSDLIVRPFGQKGVFGSIRQFTINAANDHHGMQAGERFGARWTGTDDFDGDGIAGELTRGDISALVLFQATLPAPTRLVPEDGLWQQTAALGEARFDDFGCSGCHVRALPLSSSLFSDPSPIDQAGTLRLGEVANGLAFELALLDWAAGLERDANGNILVPLFGDLKRHRIADAEIATLGNELLSQRFVEPDTFITAELWGVASTAPYGHRNDLTTLDEVIRAHGGEARLARDLYVGADEADRQAIIAFLRTLVIEP